MPYPMKKKELKLMEFTCIKCEHKFHSTQMDTDERMCYECLEGTNPGDDEDVQLGASIVKSNNKVSGVFMVNGKIKQIDYEPTTADEYNEDYIKERLNDSKNKEDKQK